MIIDQMKAFYRQRSQESCCVRKEAVGIHISVTPGNGEKKNHAIYQNNEWTSLENKDVEPVHPVYTNICQSNT